MQFRSQLEITMYTELDACHLSSRLEWLNIGHVKLGVLSNLIMTLFAVPEIVSGT